MYNGGRGETKQSIRRTDIITSSAVLVVGKALFHGMDTATLVALYGPVRTRTMRIATIAGRIGGDLDADPGADPEAEQGAPRGDPEVDPLMPISNSKTEERGQGSNYPLRFSALQDRHNLDRHQLLQW